MREVVLRVPARALDDVLDRILPVVPDGVREIPRPPLQIELRMRGPELPPLTTIARALGKLPFQISEHEVSDDWRERRLAEWTWRPRAPLPISAVAAACSPSSPGAGAGAP